MMAATTTRLLSWSGIQGMLVASTIFMVGTPAGFTVCGLSWKFPWFTDTSYASGDAQPKEVIVKKPVLQGTPVAVRCVWTCQASIILCVTVRNDQGHSIHLRSGHVNLSEVGIANSDWPAIALPQWEATRFQWAKVQIFADGELPGSPRSFKLDLTVPPGHARRFMLQIDAANLPEWQQNRFFAVGSLVLEDGTAELATPDINLFGRRLMQDETSDSLPPVVSR